MTARFLVGEIIGKDGASSYQPQIDGLVERFNQTSFRSVFMLVKDDQSGEGLYLNIELPYLCPNCSIFGQVAIYIYPTAKICVENFN